MDSETLAFHQLSITEKHSPSSNQSIFARPLPFDILCAIVAVAASLNDRELLHTLSLLNSEWNDATNQYIWHKIAIKNTASDPPPSDIAHIIRRNPHRARWIREAVVSLSIVSADDTALPSYRQITIVDSFEPVCEALHYLSNIHTLTVLVEDQFAPLAQTMSSHDFSFQLYHFRTNLYHDDGLAGFLNAHPEIQVYRQLPRRTHLYEGQLPPHLLPNLSTIVHPPFGASAMARGRPVQSIEMEVRESADMDALFEAAAASTADIHHLQLTVLEPDVLPHLFASAPERMPGLTSLSIRLQSHAAAIEIQKEPAILANLRLCLCLNEVVWRGTLIPNAVREPGVYCGPELRRVVLVRPGPVGYSPRVYARGADGTWTASRD